MSKDINELIREGSERDLYFVIDTLGGFVWRMNHDMGHGRIESTPGIEADLVRCREQQIEAIRSLARFGIDGLLDDHGAPTPRYWRWFRWWDGWKRGMTDTEWNECNRAMSRGLSADDEQRFRPRGDWRTEDDLVAL